MEDHKPSFLQFEIKNVNPVSAEDYANALSAVADEYQQFMLQHSSRVEVATSKLYIHRVEPGSIMSTLAPIITGTMPLIGSVQTAFEYAEYLSALFAWALGKLARPPVADEKKTLKNMNSIVRPTVHDQGAQLNIGAMHFQAPVHVTVNLGSSEAEAVSAFTRHRLDRLREAKPGGHHENVLLYWYQTRNAVNNKAGDRAKIDSISPDPINVSFSTEDLKREMVLDAENPYQQAYLVDVDVLTVDSKPVLYRIERLIETVNLS